MKNVLSILKNVAYAVVFTMGILSIILLIWIGGMVIYDKFRSSGSPDTAGPYIYHKTSFDKHQLVVQSGEGDADGINMMITGPDKKQVSVALGDHIGNITDSEVITLGEGRYGIALFQDSADCDQTSYVIDLFTYDKSLRHIDTISLGARNPLDGNNRKFLGTISAASPYVEDIIRWEFSIPVSVEIESEVTITPLITSEGADLVRRAMAKDRKAVMEKLSQKDMEEDLKQYLNAEKEANEVLAPRRIKFL